MTNRVSRICAALMCTLFVTSQPVRAKDLVKDVWATAVAPGLIAQAPRELTQSVERTLIQIAALEAKAVGDVAGLLEQVRSIMKEALSGSNDLVKQATVQMLALEKKINEDAVALIYRVECLGEKFAMSTVQRSFAELIKSLRKSSIRIEVLGFKLIGANADEVVVDDFDKAYWAIKRAAFEKIDRDLTVSSEAYEILSLYQNLANRAAETRCLYIDRTALTLTFTEEINNLERLSLPWTTVLKLKIGKY